MKETQFTGIPETIEQALETLTGFYPQIKEMSLKDFEAYAHICAGEFIRDAWCLWWYEGHYYDQWPSEKPPLVQCFNNLGIAHPENMSSILMTCTYRSVHNLPLGMEMQIEHHKAYWRKQGLADGIPKY